MNPKSVRLATTAVSREDFFQIPHPFSPTLTKQAAVDGARERVRRLSEYFVSAWEHGADFVTGYESVTGAGRFFYNPDTRAVFDALLEPVPGPTTEFLGGLAREHNGYCAVCLDEIDNGTVYNAAVLIGRDGNVAGKYRKVHLPPQERVYATPGNGFPVFETDFGRVGFSICYDIMFPESARCAAMNGAALLVHIGNTTYTLQEQHVRVRAAENMMWVLACNIEGMVSMIVDPMGEIVAHATRYSDTVVCADASLQLERPLPNDNRFSGVRSLRGRMCQERVPSAYETLTNPDPPLQQQYAADPIPRTAEELAAVTERARSALQAEAADWDCAVAKYGGTRQPS